MQCRNERLLRNENIDTKTENLAHINGPLEAVFV